MKSKLGYFTALGYYNNINKIIPGLTQK